ncbi:CDP-alcohol phosphatidyltransferase family protein [Microbacterium terricola]|uniref:CDP-alcohol phosphatidyltransferase n=1 Tax=Microbacterium terricola TaxID=344163 RepID=A0ABM8DV86_9MICO|nr:CDP-alcohol phosphatidyltransferase family protein [Microbacterium terricola]UYK39736.1 CDP-alcohol phosphatidyltransferase family protein [Microbacterium terricola]BDV29515.1 CDP-alcohol phosphatidyltransferase [Microbacterium terricola]
MTSVDSARPSLAETLTRLRAAQKGHARGAPAYSVYVNRRIGRVLAAVAYRFGLTPNQVTLVSAAHTFAGIALIATVPPSWWSGIVIAALLVLGYAWDSADGQVARLRGGGSVAGEWLDHFVDAIKIAALHLAVLIGLYRFAGDVDELWLLVPIGYSIVATVTFFGMILNDLLKGARGVASTHARGGGTLGRSLMLLPTDFGVLCLAFLLWGASPLFLVVYSVLFAANALFLCAASVKWFREMRRVG